MIRRKCLNQVCWGTPVIMALWRLRQVDKNAGQPSYRMKPYPNKKHTVLTLSNIPTSFKCFISVPIVSGTEFFSELIRKCFH
jgi:hypothetical protein